MNQFNIPTGYRALDNSETTQEGDIALFKDGKQNQPLTSFSAGQRIGPGSSYFQHGEVYVFIRPIASAPQGWISVKDRLPEGKFAEVGGGYVFAMKNSNITTAEFETAYHIANFAATRGFTHWMPIPELPKPPKPVIKVGEHKVDFRKNGSIKVGCTEVSSELFEKIAARRKEEMA